MLVLFGGQKVSKNHRDYKVTRPSQIPTGRYIGGQKINNERYDTKSKNKEVKCMFFFMKNK